LGPHEKSNQKIHDGARSILDRGLTEKCNFVLVGTSDVIEDLRNHPQFQESENLHLIATKYPSKNILQSLFSNNRSQQDNNQNPIKWKLHACIRGSLSSSNFLKILRSYSNNKPPEKLKQNKVNISKTIQFEDMGEKTFRLALLETAKGRQFFYAPVGIDETSSWEDRKALLENTIQFFKKIGLYAKVSLLSGGREGDKGRDPKIDENITTVERLRDQLSKDYPNIQIKHHYILIEKAMKSDSNIIIAPEGISGNLIYRTLVHLGNGRAYGAVYLNLFNSQNKVIIDTSRAAEQSEYEGAIKLALYL